jgi:ribose transport system permease protein
MRWFRSEFGIVAIFLGLCALLSVATLAEQVAGGALAGEALGTELLKGPETGVRVVIVGGEGHEDGAFVEEAARVLTAGAARVVARVQGTPRAARLVLEKLAKDGTPLDVIVASPRAGRWAVLYDLKQKYPGLGPSAATTPGNGAIRLLTPRPYVWPNFLKTDNLRNITNQIAIIAILAVGMTLVVLAGGIDLSVGSMIALAAVMAALLVRDWAGGTGATQAALLACAAAALAGCAGLGLVNGLLVTGLRVPPFIATLGMLLAASGLAQYLSNHQTISEMPPSAMRLGRGAEVLGIPNAVLLMLVLYAAAHLVMTRTTLGRYIYAVGGNAEAARLSGVPVARVVLLVYVLCAVLAGLGGIVMTSQFQGAMPTYGDKYEMYVVAAVVVGGTSIAGGEGTVLGTLIGALIIAVIQNGMNLMGLESAMQLVVLGAVIVGAVALDRLRRKGP